MIKGRVNLVIVQHVPARDALGLLRLGLVRDLSRLFVDYRLLKSGPKQRVNLERVGVSKIK